MTENTNPLKKYFRQATVYIKLPSGIQYPADVVENTESGELAVQPMTAMDEIKFKTPDALMNGQGVVDVIESCIPQIKDAWRLVSYDMDAVFLGIRIATYGETMDITYTLPGTTEKRDHTINLPAFLERVSSQKIEHSFTVDNFTFHVTPLTYRDMNLVSLETFQQQRIYAGLRNADMSDEDKVKNFDESFKKMNELSEQILKKNITKIDTGTETVENPDHINEFLKNVDARLMSKIQENLTRLRAQGSAPSVALKSTEEDIKKGAPVSYEVTVTFDTANFFV